MKPDAEKYIQSLTLPELVEKGLELRAAIIAEVEQLAQIEKRIKEFGLGHPQDHQPLKDEDREGKRWNAVGSQHILPVIFTADKIVGSFQRLTPLHQKIRVALGAKAERLGEFFALKQVYENQFDDGKKFRQRAAELLDTGAPPFITACIARDKNGIPKSDIKIQWDEVEEL